MKKSVCIESNSLTYLVDAMCGGNEPKDNLANEKKALLRTYLYRDKNLYVPPSVKEEYKKIKNKKDRQNHQEIADLLLDDILSVDLNCIDSRSQEYSRFHKGGKNKMDCKILAEAEVGGCEYLLTYDQDFLRNLREKTHAIKMMTPTEFWQALNIQKGSKPAKIPHSKNPLSKETWWVWK